MADEDARTQRAVGDHASTAERVVFDPRAPGYAANPYPLLHRLRAEDPVHRSPMGFWVLTRYADVATVLRTPRSFGTGATPRGMQARYGDGAAFAYVSRRMSSYDPPDHTRLRSLVTRAFSVRRVESMRPHIQAIADHLLDAVAGADQIDIVADVAHPLPSLVICEMLGVPEADRPQFSTWTDAIAFLLAPLIDPDRLVAGEVAAGQFMEYVRALVRERRGAPGDDLLSALIAAEEAGDRLAEDELVATVVFLFSAGHQTTRDLVGNGLLALLNHPDQWERLLDDRSLVPAAVEECLRYDSPVTLFPRRALEDTALGGSAIGAGEQVYVSISGANRDPARFPDPDRFDLARGDNEHVAFGGGIHYCLGAALARTEAQIILGTLLDRYPQLQLAENAIEWRDTLAFRGPVALHVSL
jgi:pimeloyl-[acyl-carrier protein] synthase